MSSAPVAAAPALTEFPLPVNSAPRDIVTGPDGNLWFAHNFGVSRITPTGTITAFPVAGQTSGITAGPDGNVWFAAQNANRVGRITPTGTVTTFNLPTPNSEPAHITAGPDGNLWFTERVGNKIGRITPTGTITEFPLPTPGSVPWGITAGPDGNVWFTQLGGDRIGRITPTGAIIEFPVPAGPAATPRGITAGPDGNLWFTMMRRGIGRITPTGVVTEFPTTISPFVGPEPYWIASGPDGNLWYSEHMGNGIAQITPAGSITSFPLPPVVIGGAATSGPAGIATGPDGNVWFTELLGDKIGRLTLDRPQRPLDHFQCYTGDPGGLFKSRRVSLQDQFGRGRGTLNRPSSLCAPAKKNDEPDAANPDAHLACYAIRVTPRFKRRVVKVSNQFETVRLDILAPKTLCLPAGKSHDVEVRPRAVQGLDHFECYSVRPGKRFKTRKVTLRDQFGRGSRVVLRPETLCNPVSKNREPVIDKTAHLVCYLVRAPSLPRPQRVLVSDQFGDWQMVVVKPRTLCVPSVKS